MKHLFKYLHFEVVADLHAVADNGVSLGKSIEGVRKGSVEALDLGANETTTVRTGGGQLPHGFLSRLCLLIILLREEASVDGQLGQLLTLSADIRHSVYGQDTAVLVSNCSSVSSATARRPHEAVVNSDMRELLLTVLSRHGLGRRLNQLRREVSKARPERKQVAEE